MLGLATLYNHTAVPNGRWRTLDQIRDYKEALSLTPKSEWLLTIKIPFRKRYREFGIQTSEYGEVQEET